MLSKKLICVLLSVAVFSVVGCTYKSDDVRNVGSTEIVIPVDYGNGIFYFSAVDAVFGNSLTEFIKANPSLEVCAITDDSSGVHGITLGYFVIFKKKK